MDCDDIVVVVSMLLDSHDKRTITQLMPDRAQCMFVLHLEKEGDWMVCRFPVHKTVVKCERLRRMDLLVKNTNYVRIPR